jgi:hypothetical protein
VGRTGEAQPSPPEGIFRATIEASLRLNGSLQVCVAKPELPDPDVITHDRSRPGAVRLARELLPEHAVAGRWADADSPRLLVFPELAFGSGDFAALDTLVRAHPAPLVMLAGFGFTQAAKLTELLCNPGVVRTWPEKESRMDGSYNGGWCWVHQPGVDTRCYVFLKNFRDPNGEEPVVDNPVDGKHILRLDFRDLVLFPVICSDLICNQERSPANRIAASLKAQSPTWASRVLIAGLLLTPKPEHHRWQQAIDRAVEPKDALRVLLLANHVSPPPSPREETDRWRCLTGVFVPESVASKPPPVPLPHVRFVQTPIGRASGLVLRCTGPGAACGWVQWEAGSDVGHFWGVRGRYEWTGDALVPIRGLAPAHEMRRFVARRSEAIVRRFTAAARQCVSPVLSELQRVEDESVLWPRLLYGIRQPAGVATPDLLYETTSPLDLALGILAALQWSLKDHIEPGAGKLGQIRLRTLDSEVLVWVDPEMSSKGQYAELAKFSLSPVNGPPLLVVGSGADTGQHPEPGQVRPLHSTSITRSVAGREPRVFTQPRLRRVHWYPLAWLQDELRDQPDERALRGFITAAVRDQIPL